MKAKADGQIVSIDQNIGEFENAITGQAMVATMIDPTQLRVVGYLDENKGLADVAVGDPATFTVDAFGGKQYQGIVDEVSPTSRASDVVFNISDQRPTNQFDVYVRFDPAKYPELKNGMSARIWVQIVQIFNRSTFNFHSMSNLRIFKLDFKWQLIMEN